MRRHFLLHPSYYLALCIVSAHVLAMGALCFIPVPAPALLLLLVVLTCSMAYYVLRDAGLRLAGACVALRLEDERVVLIERNGAERAGRLQRGSVVTPYLVVLNIEMPGQRRRRDVLVLPDSMDAESFRQLRVALKWYAGFSA